MGGLLDHELLLESLYMSQGIDLQVQQSRATALLAEIGLRTIDLGVKNLDEEGRELVNQCFYLSIARSYLGHAPCTEEVRKVALHFKRSIEACVLAAHPDWATDSHRLGENAMAFADFLPIAMGAKEPPNLASRLAVVVIDCTQCHAESYIGPRYLKEDDFACAEAEHCAGDRTREELEKHLVILSYTPGHYNALVRDDDCASRPAWTYQEFKDILDARGVMCIETSDFD